MSAAHGNVGGDDPGSISPDDELALAPTICFYMVASADGSIDKKEAKWFLVEVMRLTTHSNPLVRQVFEATSQRFESFVQTISQAPTLSLVRLVRCRRLAEQSHPEHAIEFCQVLFDMAVSIARASGGFLGMGSPISKLEHQALTVIATSLGVSVENGGSHERSI